MWPPAVSETRTEYLIRNEFWGALIKKLENPLHHICQFSREQWDDFMWHVSSVTRPHNLFFQSPLSRWNCVVHSGAQPWRAYGKGPNCLRPLLWQDALSHASVAHSMPVERPGNSHEETSITVASSRRIRDDTQRYSVVTAQTTIKRLWSSSKGHLIDPNISGYENSGVLKLWELGIWTLGLWAVCLVHVLLFPCRRTSYNDNAMYWPWMTFVL